MTRPVSATGAGDPSSARPGLLALTGRTLGAIPPTFQVLLGIVSVQVGAASAKQLFAEAGAAGTVALRLFFAAVVLMLIWRPTLRLDRRAVPVVLTYGVVLGVMNLCFYQSIARIPLGIAVTVEFLGPLGVALAGSRRLLDGLWALLAGAGVVLLTEARGDLSTVGLVFALAAGLCWGAYILLTAALGNRTSDGQGLAVAMAVGALVVMPVGIVETGTGLLDPWVLMIALAVALLSSVIPYSLELEALRSIPPRVFGVLMSLEPAVGALAGLSFSARRCGRPSGSRSAWWSPPRRVRRGSRRNRRPDPCSQLGPGGNAGRPRSSLRLSHQVAVTPASTTPHGPATQIGQKYGALSTMRRAGDGDDEPDQQVDRDDGGPGDPDRPELPRHLREQPTGSGGAAGARRGYREREHRRAGRSLTSSSSSANVLAR